MVHHDELEQEVDDVASNRAIDVLVFREPRLLVDRRPVLSVDRQRHSTGKLVFYISISLASLVYLYATF